MMNAREVIARAIHEGADNPFAPWEGMEDLRMQQADAALSAYHAHLEAAGLAIVPVEATEAMLDEYWKVANLLGLADRTLSSTAYRAMIAAAKDQNDG